MKKLLFLAFIMLPFVACTDNYLTTGDENGIIEHPAVNELNDNLGGDNGTYDRACVDRCNFDYEDCYETAVRMRDQDYLACEQIRIESTEIVDVICTRTVIVGYRTIITPEGEEIEIPIVEVEEYVCGQEEVIIYTDDEVKLEEYRQCRIDAIEYFLEEVESCESKKGTCLKKCKKGPVGPQF